MSQFKRNVYHDILTFCHKEVGIQYVRNELVCKLLTQDYTHFSGFRDLEIDQKLEM